MMTGSVMNLEPLIELTESMNTERNHLLGEIQQKEMRISEIDSYLDSLLKDEEGDFKVFSPRNAASVYKNEISSSNEEKEVLEKEISSLNKKLYVCEERLGKFEGLRTEIDNCNSPSDISFVEKEKQALAAEIHDTSLQDLAHIIHKLDLGILFIDQDPNRAKLELEITKSDIKKVIQQLRDTISQLRPMTLDDIGLPEAIEGFVEHSREMSNFSFDIDVEDVSRENPDFSLNILRIVQEGISNAIKHSGGDNIKVLVKKEEKCVIINIHDNGHGFSSDIDRDFDNHYGLKMTKERVNLYKGEMTIESSDTGSSLIVRLPL